MDDNYLTRYAVYTANGERVSAATLTRGDPAAVAALRTHLEQQAHLQAQLIDHLQCAIMVDLSIEYTQIGKEQDTQRVSVEAALDTKLGVLARNLYPHGLDDLIALQQLIRAAGEEDVDLSASPVMRHYAEREGLKNKATGRLDPDAWKKHLEALQGRYRVNSTNDLSAKLATEQAAATALFQASGTQTLHVQDLLLKARADAGGGAAFSSADKALIIAYLKQKDIVSKQSTEAIIDFSAGSAAINQPKMEAHIQLLSKRYKVDAAAQARFTTQLAFVTACRTGNGDDGGQRTQAIMAFANNGGNRNQLAFLKRSGVIAADVQGEVTADHIDMGKAHELLQDIGIEHGMVEGHPTATAVLDVIHATLQRDFPEANGRDQNQRLIAKISHLQAHNLTAGVVTLRQEAQEKMARIALIKDLWMLTTGEKSIVAANVAHAPNDPTKISQARANEITLFLRTEGAELSTADPATWKAFIWKGDPADDAEADSRKSIKEILNTALETDLRVVNTGQTGSRDHVLGKINEALDRNKRIASGQMSSFAIQKMLHKESLEGAVPASIVLNADDGYAKVVMKREFDPKTGRWKEDYYTSGVKISLSKALAKEVKDLWDTKVYDSKRPLYPETPRPPKKEKQRLGN